MSIYEKLSVIFGALTLLGTGFGALWYEVRRLGSNHITHLDAKLDDIKTDVKSINAKLDGHILWHLDKHGR